MVNTVIDGYVSSAGGHTTTFAGRFHYFPISPLMAPEVFSHGPNSHVDYPVPATFSRCASFGI
jgi:hypothetical protein